MKKKIIIVGSAIVALAVSVGIGLTTYAKHSLARLSKFEFATGHAAIEKIQKAGVPVPAGAREPMYWYECGIDHTAYMSYMLPERDVPAHVRQVMAAFGTSGEPKHGTRSEFAWINAGPNKKPREWQNRHWALSSVTDGIMYEERHRFICADLATGRVYVSTWSE